MAKKLHWPAAEAKECGRGQDAGRRDNDSADRQDQLWHDMIKQSKRPGNAAVFNRHPRSRALYVPAPSVWSTPCDALRG
jgi:hypothetical protein